MTQKPDDPVAAEISAMRGELARMRGEQAATRAEVVASGLIVARLERALDAALTPRPEPIDPDPPVGVVAAAELSGKSAKTLRRLIDRGAGFGWYDGATGRYVVRLGALRDHLVAEGEPVPDALKGVRDVGHGRAPNGHRHALGPAPDAAYLRRYDEGLDQA